MVLVLGISVAGAVGVTRQTPDLSQPCPVDRDGKLGAQVCDALASVEPDEKVAVVVTLREQANLETPLGLARAPRLERVIRALQAQAEASQRSLRPLLNSLRANGQVGQLAYF